jgi:hypothetical protein
MPNGRARTSSHKRRPLHAAKSRPPELCYAWDSNTCLAPDNATYPVLHSSCIQCCQVVILGGLSDGKRFQHTVYFFIWICFNIAGTDLVACRPSYAEAQRNSDVSFLRRRREQVYGGNRFTKRSMRTLVAMMSLPNGGIRTAPCRSSQSSSFGGIGLAGF